MTLKTNTAIDILGAKTNNLKNVSLKIPHNKFIVVTGISGSGKSSLVFDIIAKEGQRRYFETLPSFARLFTGKLNRPDVDNISGLSPVIAIGQRTSGVHARSTVGTLSDIYDLLRLLFARTGITNQPIKLSRALFSFNSAIGKCKQCNGIGKEEQIDLNRLISSPNSSIRNGALAPTLPNGYIMYSQVTIDVLNQVCNAEGFNVDILWNDLTEAQQHVILYGSHKIKVPFGKHSLESRLKWSGIKAKPREEGFYKGIIPIMADILRRDRNANILKYVHSVTCTSCNGTRLNNDALRVTVKGKTIADVVNFEVNQLKTWITSNSWSIIAKEITAKIEAQANLLDDLGLGHLTLNRTSKSLRSSEIQRIRIANQILAPLSDVLYVFDEPSIGLHKDENERLIFHFKELVKKGNTVIVVEHDLDTILSANHIIEIGPKAGINGGELIFNGSFKAFSNTNKLINISPTYKALLNSSKQIELTQLKVKNTSQKAIKSMSLNGCFERNLKHIDVKFQLGKLNVVSGKSGVGKSSLVKGTLLKLIEQKLGIKANKPAKLDSFKNIDAINKLIFIDHSPIGKTPRSNPATYLGVSDFIRDIFARLPESKAQGFTKSRFSFNNKGGRCETCQGAGKIQIGMHFLGHIDLVCGTCNGDRFNAETLQIKYKNLSIADCYKLAINEAVTFFATDKKVLAGLQLLQDIGLGYLTLGQSSTTLSGGEAQRIKIANQLQKKDTGDTLYVIIEPSIGLHYNDIKSLTKLFSTITKKGNTIVCIEQDNTIINSSDWHIELGPNSGVSGGTILYQGVPKNHFIKRSKELGVKANKQNLDVIQSKDQVNKSSEIVLNGVTTHGLKNINVRIPKNQLTVVTGISGSGKSSLVYDTLFSESNARFTESLSTYNRSFLQENSEAKIASFTGLSPAIGINRKGTKTSNRSTVGTLSGVYNAFRLLYSRIAQHEGKSYTAQHFSFNHYLGACPECEGLGFKLKTNPEAIITSPDKSIFNGAIAINKTIGYYADSNGQFIATLKEVAKQKNLDLTIPWKDLDNNIRAIILYGTGDIVWNTTWKYTTKSRVGSQEISVKWLGFCNYIDEEYQRKLHNKNIKNLEDLLHHVECNVCNGSRLKPELLKTTFLGVNIYELSKLSISACLELINKKSNKSNIITAISSVVLPSILKSLETITDLGLGYLNLNRTVNSLSGGERQRVTLASQLSTHLFGVTYVLDEPTIGLDQTQVTVLSNVLKQIVANGNTVVVVEHDLDFIKTADYIIEMGPNAGKLGGQVIYQGTLKNIVKAKDSVTYKLIYNKPIIPIKALKSNGVLFGVKGAFANNLKTIDVSFKTEQIIAVKGVSGSGKSSLIKDVLYRSWMRNSAVNCTSVYGLEQFDSVLLINQDALKQSRLSTPVTYSGIIDAIKTLFSKTESAKKAGFKKADFSYQSKKGKCTSCNGYGKLKTSMDFMSDIWLNCTSCNGMRYNKSLLAITYKKQSIGAILQMTVLEAISFFESGKIVEQLEILNSVGVGHLVLGQSGHTLSGGEAQRLKLATAMLQKRKGSTLYLFDEPSTGLHYFDILKLIKVFQLLVNQGNTVLFIEHNSTLISSANQVVTLGPKSGDNGGELVN